MIRAVLVYSRWVETGPSNVWYQLQRLALWPVGLVLFPVNEVAVDLWSNTIAMK